MIAGDAAISLGHRAGQLRAPDHHRQHRRNLPQQARTRLPGPSSISPEVKPPGTSGTRRRPRTSANALFCVFGHPGESAMLPKRLTPN
jgi:hypothetical protein